MCQTHLFDPAADDVDYGGVLPSNRTDMAKKSAIDPLTGPKLALTGQVVTMDDAFSTLRRGTVYIDQGGIVAVQEADRPAPRTTRSACGKCRGCSRTAVSGAGRPSTSVSSPDR